MSMMSNTISSGLESTRRSTTPLMLWYVSKGKNTLVCWWKQKILTKIYWICSFVSRTAISSHPSRITSYIYTENKTSQRRAMLSQRQSLTFDRWPLTFDCLFSFTVDSWLRAMCVCYKHILEAAKPVYAIKCITFKNNGRICMKCTQSEWAARIFYRRGCTHYT